MKAAIVTNYGSPDVLTLEEIEKPSPKENEVLVKVIAASLNSADLEYLRGDILLRLGSPTKPAYRILGTDIAGRVEAVGSNVEGFQIGDEVYGDLTLHGFGAFAEYVAVPASAIAHKPRNLSFVQAAATPTAGIIALQAVRDYGRLQTGQTFLINGAGGGVGTFAIQLAQHYGASITAVDSTDKFEFLRSLRVSECIDYRTKDYTRVGQKYDLVLDVIAKRSIFDYRRVINPNGTFGMIGGSVGSLLQSFAIGSWLSRDGKQKLGIVMVLPKQEDLIDLRDLLEAETIKPIIDKVYSFAEIKQAFLALGAGKVCGKVVIQINAEAE